MRFETGRRERRSVGLTPMIDVVFLLLVFFMLASSLAGERALPVEVGSVGTAPSASEEAEPLRVELVADGRVRVAGEWVAPTALSAALRPALAADATRTVWLVPDDAVRVQRIADALDALRSAGARRAVLAPER